MALLPALDSTLSEILLKYPLPETRVLETLKTGKRNDNFLVEDASGNRYVLRRYRRNNQEKRVRFQLRFQQYLDDIGFPTSKIVTAISGDVLVVGADSPWALFTFIEGKEYDFSRVGQVVGAARRLARFHTATEKLPHQEVVLDINRMPDWWANGERGLEALEEFFAGRAVDSRLLFIRQCLNELLREWPLIRNAGLKTAWVHGDYHGGNMVFVGDEMRGLFDFDVVHRGFRIEDIAWGMYMFGRRERNSNVIREDVAMAFLEEYTRNAELLRDELEALPVFAVLWCIPNAPYFLMLQRDGEDPVAYLRSFTDIMRAMRSEMKRLKPVIGRRFLQEGIDDL